MGDKIFNPGYHLSLTEADKKRYSDKVELCGGIDRYELNLKDLCADRKAWPLISEIDRFDYFVNRAHYITKKEVKSFKSLLAAQFVVDGLVHPPMTKKIEGGTLILAKVHHSQTFSASALKCWILVDEDNDIITEHYNCVAGVGERCSHVAAVVFYLEGDKDDRKSCTDVLNKWLPPTLTSAPYREVKDIDFTAPDTKLRKQHEKIEDCSASTQKTERTKNNHPVASADEVNLWLDEIQTINPTAVTLQLFSPHCHAFVYTESLPLLLCDLYKPDKSEWSDERTLLESEKVYNDVVESITKEQILNAEMKSVSQSKSDFWYDLSCGRVTGSTCQNVMIAASKKEPCKTTLQSICYPRNQKFSTFYTERGKKMEPVIKKFYLDLMKMSHVNMLLSESGFVICKQYPFIGAPPDGLVHCDCCGKGLVELKHPKLENLFASLKDRKLDLNNAYYQIQCQLFVCDLLYCDFFVFADKDNYYLERITRDEKCVKEIVEKGSLVFKKFILPELLTKQYTKDRISTVDESPICFCQRPRFNPVVTCAGDDKCTFLEFHGRCVGLESKPKNLRYCQECKHLKKKPLSTKNQ